MKLFGSENITNMKKEIFEDFTRRQSKILSKAVAFRKSIRSGIICIRNVDTCHIYNECDYTQDIVFDT